MPSLTSWLRRPQGTYSVAQIIEAYEMGKTAGREAAAKSEETRRELDRLIAAGPQPIEPAQPTGLRLVVTNR